MIQQLTGIGLILDVIVCTFFASRLTIRYRKNRNNHILQNFIWFFWIYDIFLVTTFFYIPNLVVSAGPDINKLAFTFGFLLLFIVSAIAIRVVFYLKFPKLSSMLVFWFFVEYGIVDFVYNLLSPNLAVGIQGSDYVLQWAPWQGFAAGFPVGVAFIATSYVFFTQGLANPKDRRRSYLLSAAFLLWIVGGSAHALAFSPLVSIGADILASLGFTLAFISLMSSPNGSS